MASATAPLPLIASSTLVTWLDRTELSVRHIAGPHQAAQSDRLAIISHREIAHRFDDQNSVGQHVDHAPGKIQLEI